MPKTIISTEDAVTAIMKIKKEHKTIGFIPTMGALHEGHLSLVSRAKEVADVVFVSIFVNPTQFGPSEDFAKYPRTLKRDLQLLEALEVDYVFAPTANDLYPSDFQTWADNDGVSNQLCGASRSGHFKGVCTIVLKFFNIIQPNYAFFGKKDYQQLAVVKNMVRDLNLQIDVHGVEIKREHDGLAMSSRNAYLTDEGRQVSTHISQSLNVVFSLFNDGERNVEKLRDSAIQVLSSHNQIELEYCEIRDQKNLEEFQDVVDAACVMLIAAKISNVRLIDNIELGTYEFV